MYILVCSYEVGHCFLDGDVLVFVFYSFKSDNSVHWQWRSRRRNVAGVPCRNGQFLGGVSVSGNKVRTHRPSKYI